MDGYLIMFIAGKYDWKCSFKSCKSKCLRCLLLACNPHLAMMLTKIWRHEMGHLICSQRIRSKKCGRIGEILSRSLQLLPKILRREKSALTLIFENLLSSAVWPIVANMIVVSLKVKRRPWNHDQSSLLLPSLLCLEIVTTNLGSTRIY